MSLGKKEGLESLFSKINESQSQEHERLTWDGSFSDYLGLVAKRPEVTRNAFQRVYEMIMGDGFNEYTDIKKPLRHYKFFDDQRNNGDDAIFGLDIQLMKFVEVLQSAAKGFAARKRVLLLHGPVGSSKSTIARLLKKGLEDYSRTDDGALFTFEWNADSTNNEEIIPCPMHEEPLKLVPQKWREQISDEFSNEKFHVHIEGDLCPVCRTVYHELSEKYKGEWSEIIKHVTVRRFLMSEKDRIGIGTFQPKDEKNQDSTELTGDINYRKIAKYGSESDPRAFNFDGEFQVANRGIVEFIEVLKLDVAFLYDLLGASQEHSIKPKKFAQTSIDEVIIGHTNEPEFKKLQENQFMEALKDRTIKIDIPYVTKWPEEVKIYQKDFSQEKLKNKHLAPHTLEMAAQWVVMTRLEPPTNGLEIIQKMKLYAGKRITGYTDDHVKELRKAAKREGLDGISPRYVQDKISNAIMTSKADSCLNPFLVLTELEKGLDHHSLIKNADDRERYIGYIKVIRQEYEDIAKNEVQKAISADVNALSSLCANYIDNIKAFTQKERVKNKYTGQYEDPDEKLMRSIEDKVDVPEGRKLEFRREIMNYIGAMAIDGKKFSYDSNERLKNALEAKLFEDSKDSIKLSTLVSNVIDADTQKKIEVVKQRMIERNGYCEICATDVLSLVSSIFARGDAKKE